MVDKKIKISVAIPTFNSADYIENALINILDDDRIDDVVISDDTSNDFEELEKKVGNVEKIRLFRNPENLGGFLNKIEAVEKCRNTWVIVLDSDNSLSDSYVDKLYEIPNWVWKYLYHPDFGLTRLNYTKLSGKLITPSNIERFIKKEPAMLKSFLNTGNFFANRDQYLKVARSDAKIRGHVPCSIVFTYLWLKNHNSIQVVKGMCYTHRIRRSGYWGRNASTFTPIVDGITKALVDGYEYRF